MVKKVVTLGNQTFNGDGKSIKHLPFTYQSGIHFEKHSVQLYSQVLKYDFSGRPF